MRAILLTIILMCFGVSQMSAAKTIEVKSENFILVGDISKSSATGLVEDLEEYRSAIFQIFRATPGPEKIPVRIYTLKSSEEIEKVTGMAKSAGVYTITPDGPVFVLSSKSGFKSDNRAAKIAYHEYTHHLMAQFTSQKYPRWYNEGIAEYLATFKARKKKFQIGIPDTDHRYILDRTSWFPMDTLIGSVRRYPFLNGGGAAMQRGRAMFYAQSWLAVHYLQSTPGMGKKFGQYMKIMKSGVKSVEAFETAFGMTPDEFGKVLRTYYKANRYNYATVELTDKSEVEMQITVLDANEAAKRRAEAKYLFTGG
ncbi:MAG: hypothetical protein EX271_09740 [Acidimicrobiales bacterium]|nr:hypothetical protein [Hyphomonadaceae bacterium]RZV40686.1 MAG: hypothetical protein EX271_09740 [Acidimicrobiales bacterium]